MKIAAALWRVLRGFGLVLAAIVIFVEEWGWRPLTALAAALARWLHAAARSRRASPASLADRRAAALSRAGAAARSAQAARALADRPGRAPALGIAIIVAAKVLGTAFVGRLFILVEPQLMTFAWFARALRLVARDQGRAIGERVRTLGAVARPARALRRLWRGAGCERRSR